MSRRSKRKAEAAAAAAAQGQAQQGQAQVQPAPAPTTASTGRQTVELQVFDGRGHAGMMVFSTDEKGTVRQRLRKGRDWGAKLPQARR